MKDRNFLDTVMEFEQQLESMQQQFSALKQFVAHMMEEHQTLQTENLHLRTASRRSYYAKRAAAN